MSEVSIIGIDLAKRSFQLHGARADGSVAFRKKLSRGKLLAFLAAQPRCVVAMEACASAHYWGREIMKLGHEVRLIAPIYVKPFVKRQKNDAADAEAICEAAVRPSMALRCGEGGGAAGAGDAVGCFDARSSGAPAHPDNQRAARAPGGVWRHRAAGESACSPSCLGRRGPRLVSSGAGARAGRSSAWPDRGPRWQDRRPGEGAPHPGTRGRGGCAADDDPGDRSHHRDGDPGLRAADGELPLRARLLGLAGPGAAPALDRGQAEAGEDLEDGPARSQTALGLRRHVRGSRGGAAGETRDPWLAQMLERKPRMVVAVALANRMARIAWALTVKKEVYRLPAAA